MKPQPDSYITAVLTTAEQLHRQLATIEPGLLVLIGAAGSGKSTVAAAHNRTAVAVHLDTPLAVCQARNRARPDGPRVPDDTLAWQHEHAVSAVLGLQSEGFAAAFTLRTANAIPRENS
ncbi:hypothetical protein RVR_P197 (plasmid) [Actinacidiphila reveromycinica]|uniref:Uncharacterized protein n=1 Tax=Actinacidiphila reveromycinica TaxID=659352 RepID=A0A7U3VU75_9ACTN|nr:hypothetical protein [Streptomyces sp. SN-593]BBG20714.1 hypothetical protein RVR_P197 [Streptomyces sp. SN-593]